ncbi:MAG: hypothetical protein R2827_11485 [Bdellovibrionales bacterium]
MLTLEIPCQLNKNNFTSPAKQIRLRMRKCPDYDSTKTDLKIYNSTNAYQASVFDESYTHVSTDYIYLRDGDNVINIENSSKDG